MSGMNNENLSKDSLAIILLCSNLTLNKNVDSVKPFTTTEWSKFAKIVFNSSIKRPANLFNLSSQELQEKLFIKESEATRILNLLSKAGQLSFQLNELNNLGIKIMTRADKIYPNILKKRLKEKCPPLIYYCGDITILENQLIGVVGSRNIDVDGLEFTKKIGQKIVKEGYSLVSGGAKGADSIAQEEVLNNNGKVAAFIADSMISKIKKKDIREAIIEKKLLLMSVINPKSGFTVYSAMDRNKYIYCLSEITVVVSSDYNKGGTWTGAIENLKNKWVPIVVRNEENLPKGNVELIKQGGIVFNTKAFENKFSDFMKVEIKCEELYYENDLLSLANNDSSKEVFPIEKDVIVNNENYAKVEDSYKNKVVVETYDVYELIIDKIKEALKIGVSLDEFQDKFHVNKKQASEWLNRAIDDGIVKKLNKPVRYKSI